jgi:hypothetical protein
MANPFRRGSQPGRILALPLGLLLAAALLAGLPQRTLAKDPPKTEPSKTDEPKKNPPTHAPAAGPGASEQVRYINELIDAQWKENKIIPSTRANDYEFIRRVSLDIIGRIAKPQEIDQFFRDPAQTRRALLIERLLASEEYPKNWANIWTVWLMSRGGALERGRGVYHEQMHLWLEEQFVRNRSYKEMVTDLLTATGKTNENGAVNYVLTWLGEPIPNNNRTKEGQFEMTPITARTTRLFLGMQVQCVQCHNHPSGPGIQKDFWGINAFFRQVERDGMPMMGRDAVLTLKDNLAWNTEGLVYFEKRDGLLLSTRPSFFLERRKEDDKPIKIILSPTTPRRVELAKLITNNEYFAKAFVNRMWAHFMGRGIQMPVDDFGIPDNPPSNPELLDRLAKDFAGTGHYDPKEVIRWICNSTPYNLTSVANGSAEVAAEEEGKGTAKKPAAKTKRVSNDKAEIEPYFSRVLLKAMTPEQLFESLLVATRTEVGLSKENKKKLREEWIRSLVVNFGDDEGNEVTFNGTVVQALMLMNGKQINDAITHKDGTVAQAMRRRSVLNDLFLAALNRPPTSKELGVINREIALARAKNQDYAGVYQDIFWGLLNSNEFLLNH